LSWAPSPVSALSLSAPYRHSLQFDYNHRRDIEVLFVHEADVGQTEGISEEKCLALAKIPQLGRHFDSVVFATNGVLKFIMSAESRKQYPDG
jgi:hypothetical protein